MQAADATDIPLWVAGWTQDDCQYVGGMIIFQFEWRASAGKPWGHDGLQHGFIDCQ